MKKIGTIFSLLSLSLLAVSCGLDNYDEPESFLEGKITYEGKQLGLKGTNVNTFRALAQCSSSLGCT